MLKTIYELAKKLAPAGWRPAAIHRLIARIEADGRATPAERASVRELIANDGFSTFRGHTRSLLTRYAEFAERVASPPPIGPSLFGDDKADVDVARYRRHIEVLAGERPAEIRDGDRARRVRFTDRFVPSPNNQLADVLKWLGQHYTALGFDWRLEPVRWKDRTFFNLVVTIPGESKDAIVLADHYDVADKEAIVLRNEHQLSDDHGLSPGEIAAKIDRLPVGHAVPGADDNASATAALMEMGSLLRERLDRGVKLGRTIQLVHLVGEEMPGDGFGVKQFLQGVKARGDSIAGAVVLDMIAVDRTGLRKVQLSPGRATGSLELAAQAKDAIGHHGLDLVPVLRPFGSRKSFLHQTDGIHFSRAGIPVLLLNEHLNDDRDLYRVGYHDEFDTTRLIDFGFAADVTRTALDVVYRNALPIEPGAK